MRIWHYDTETLILIHSGESYADKDPLSPGMFLIQAGATPIAPLPEAEGKTRHFDKVSSVWFYRDVPPAPEAPPEPDPKDLRRVEIIGRLSAIDAASVRPQREVIAALAAGDPAPAFAVEKLAALEAEAAQLRAELAALNA